MTTTIRHKRYILVPPVPAPEGDPFWRVGDTQYVTEDGEPIPNFPVVEIHKSVPNAEREARIFCDRLNGGEYRYMPASDITGQTYHPPDPA